METKGLISVIVPIYKVEKYLNRCIQSIVGQTYRNLEIILVDDGSPDLCPQMCDEWARKDSRIKVIHKENGGLSDARNAGVAIAKGEYIGFIDSDDYIDEEMYERLYVAIEAAKADLAICNFEMVTEEGLVLSEDSPVKDECFTGLEGLKKIIDAGGWYYVTAWNKLYSRKALKGIKFPIGKINEDQFIVHKVFFQCDKIVSISPKLYKYVQRDGSIMNSIKSVQGLDEVEAFCEKFNFYKDHGLEDCYPQLLSGLKWTYCRRRLNMPKISDKYQRKRVREIDKMFKAIYFVYSEKITMKERIIYNFPSIWDGYCSLRKIREDNIK